MQDGESWLQSGNQQRAVLITEFSSAHKPFQRDIFAHITNPMANVLQSAEGASAVTAIWSIVLAEMCSDVVGSKSMMFP